METMVATPCGPKLFVYGTLMAPKVVTMLIGRMPKHQKARILGYKRHPVRGFVFPGVTQSALPSDAVEGLLLEDLSKGELKRFDWFEGTDYKRITVPVECVDSSATESAFLYLWDNPLDMLARNQQWDFEAFCQRDMESYLMYTVLPSKRMMDSLLRDD